MRKLLVIGIGAGDPDQVTVQAVRAMNTVDVFFVLDKGRAKADLVALRKEILERHVTRSHHVVEVRDPDRDRSPADYGATVEAWHDARTALFESAFLSSLPPDGVGAFLVWGDPSLYDGTLRIVDRMLARGQVSFSYSVIPGVTSIQALTAAHRIPLNRTGEPIHVTPARRLPEETPEGLDNVVVMLDRGTAFESVDPDLHIYWGAYLGTPDELLISGRVGDVGPEIARARAAARADKGWIMDTYLLRRDPPRRGPAPG